MLVEGRVLVEKVTVVVWSDPETEVEGLEETDALWAVLDERAVLEMLEVLLVLIVLVVLEELVVMVVGVEKVEEVVVVLVVAPTDPKNSSTLLLVASAAHRFPEESRAIPSGFVMPLWVVAGIPVVKPGCPMTRDALSPVERGAPNTRTLSFPVSATQRFPDRSNAIPSG